MGDLRIFKPRPTYKASGPSAGDHVTAARLAWALRVIRLYAHYHDSGIAPIYPPEPGIYDKESRI